jgi:hypothetical protein
MGLLNGIEMEGVNKGGEKGDRRCEGREVKE